MARYVDGDALIKWAREQSFAQGIEGKVLCFDFETAVRKYELVDVAPKSEVANEIFTEIESNMIDITMEFSTLRAIGSKKLAKLKKKYTEDKT